MKFFTRFNRRNATARLVFAGLLEGQRRGRRNISNTMHLLAGALGDSFDSLHPRAAAGMVLLALAKNSTLGRCLNDSGWALVIALLDEHPEIAARLSPGTSLEIAGRRPARPDLPIAQAA